MSREDTRQAGINTSSPGVNSVVSVGNTDDIQDGTNDSDHIKEYEKEEADLTSSIHELEKNILKLRIQNKKKRESFLKQQLQAQQMLMDEMEKTGLADSTIRDVAYQSLPEISPMPSTIQGMFDLPSTPCSSLARNIEPSLSFETDSTIRDVAYHLPESSQMPSAIQGMFDLPSTPCSSLVRNIEPSLSYETGKMRQEREAAASQIEEQANLISKERQQILGPDTDNMPVLLEPEIPQKTVISQVPQDDSSVKPAQTKPAPPAISPKPAKPRPAVPLNLPKPSVTPTKTVDDILNQSRMSSASTYGGERPRIREGGSFSAKKNFFENEIQEQERQTKTQAKHFKYFSELEPAKMKKEEDPTIRDVAYQSLPESSSIPSAVQGMFDLPSTPYSSLARNIEPSLSYETVSGKMRQEREAASQVEEQVNLMSLEPQQILGPDTDNMPMLLGPETPQKTVISQVPQDDSFVKPAQTKPAPPTYGGDGPRIREGGSFNEKKKFFENEIQEQERQTKTQVEERRMLLIGKTGHGKSFTGNTILGRNAFKVSCYSQSETQRCICESAQRLGKKLVVVDTPGMFDTRMTNDAIKEELVRACGFLSPGFHAILLVLRAGERHTEENRQVVDICQRLFGQELFKYTFLVITSWDTVEKEVQSLENFIRHGSESMRQLLDLCEKRCFVVSNKGTPSVKVKQVNALLEGIETNLARFNGRCFSNLVFKGIEFYLFLDTQNKQITEQAQNESELQEILASSDDVPENDNQDYRDDLRKKLSPDGHSGIFGRLIRALRCLFDK